MGQVLLLEWFNSQCEGVVVVLFLKSKQWVPRAVSGTAQQPRGSAWSPFVQRGLGPAALGQAGHRNLSFDILQVLWCVRMLFAVGTAHPGYFHMESGRTRCLAVHPSCPTAQMFLRWGGELLANTFFGGCFLPVALVSFMLAVSDGIFSSATQSSILCQTFSAFTLVVSFLSFVLLPWVVFLPFINVHLYNWVYFFKLQSVVPSWAT